MGTTLPMSPTPPQKPAPEGPSALFDRARARHHRARSARHFQDADFLHRRAMADIVDRLETVMRSFPKAAFFGTGDLINLLTAQCGVGRPLVLDNAPGRLPEAGTGTGPVVADEDRLPLAPESFDLVVSLLTLHRIDDIIGTLIQYRQALKPDGLFIAAVFSGETLATVKQAFLEAETAQGSGAGRRVYPFADVRQWGNALSRAGFTLPVTDIDPVRVTYQNPDRLFTDLRAMGETSALTPPVPPLTRSVVADALSRLAARGDPTLFEVTYLTAWSPHPDQPKPLKPGSATVSMQRVFE
ncbi:MAG: methyltransferase domain-containing protein [Pseudomonadota bacterium]